MYYPFMPRNNYNSYNNYYNPYYNRNFSYPYYSKKNVQQNSPNKSFAGKSSSSINSNQASSIKVKSVEEENKNEENSFFEILGMKLYFDDILLICLILFLYNEEVKDYSLFLSLILLLMS